MTGVGPVRHGVREQGVMATPTIVPTSPLHRPPRTDPTPGDPSSGDGQPRQDVALCASYVEAALLAERLAERGFPMEHVTIVADDEPGAVWAAPQPTLARAAVRGLDVGSVAGAVAGLLFGLLYRIDHPGSVLVMAIYGLALGALAGATLAVVSHGLRHAGERSAEAAVGALASPVDHHRHVVVADDPSSWVHAVTMLHGGGRPTGTVAP